MKLLEDRVMYYNAFNGFFCFHSKENYEYHNDSHVMFSFEELTRKFNDFYPYIYLYVRKDEDMDLIINKLNKISRLYKNLKS